MARRIEPEFRPSQNHWLMRPGLYKERVTRQQLRQVLLNQPRPIVGGMCRDWKFKHIGVGVYDLWVGADDGS